MTEAERKVWELIFQAQDESFGGPLSDMTDAVFAALKEKGLI